MTPARLGLICALATLILDQASKVWLLRGAQLELTQPMVLAPFLEFVVVWNRGISYGLFQLSGETWRYVLIGASLAATVLLLVWMVRATNRLLAVALGLIAGGAVGNAIDRIAYGAVFDFVHVHVAGFSWYVFNLADAAIVAGVVGLLYDSLLGQGASEAHGRGK